MGQLENICVNIWDDFNDKDKKTYIIVEENVEEPARKRILQKIIRTLKKEVDLSGIGLELVKNHYNKEFSCWEVEVTGITQKKLSSWMKILIKKEIRFKNIPLNIYSES